MNNSNASAPLAAIDLGSNSFHLLIADYRDGVLAPLARKGEKVQLGLGLSAAGLAADAIARGLACLAQFARLLQQHRVGLLRVVATQALRLARNRQVFIEPAQRLLGCPVEVISGQEEARLVYRGVSQGQGARGAPQLVMDIGGGSTELVLGQGDQVRVVNSLALGCVDSLRYFPQGQITADNLQRAYQAAAQQLAAVNDQYRGQWQHCIGCSGTLLALEQVLIQQRLVSQGISRAGLLQLRQQLLAFHHLDEVAFQGLKESRRQVFASGLAICLALFDGLQIEHMSLSQAALREGVLMELVAKP